MSSVRQSSRRIKGTHIPRIALAAVALFIFFGTLWAELVDAPLDFRDPLWGGLMVVFLFCGIGMLALSWGLGPETRAEVWITIGMIVLHVLFDGFILIWVFALDNPLPVPVVQVVVQAYWMAGLLDVLLMFWAANFEQTAPSYVPPEQVIAELRQNNALLTASLKHAEREQQRTSERAERLLEEASRVYTETCEVCGASFDKPSREQARRALAGHTPHCPGPAAHPNGKKLEPSRSSI